MPIPGNRQPTPVGLFPTPYRADITLKDTILTANEPLLGQTPDFGFFPNPARSQVELRLPDAMPTRVELFDANGRRRWFSAKAQDGDVVPLRHLPKGVYTVRFTSANRAEAKKLLVE